MVLHTVPDAQKLHCVPNEFLVQVCLVTLLMPETGMYTSLHLVRSAFMTVDEASFHLKNNDTSLSCKCKLLYGYRKISSTKNNLLLGYGEFIHEFFPTAFVYVSVET